MNRIPHAILLRNAFGIRVYDTRQRKMLDLCGTVQYSPKYGVYYCAGRVYQVSDVKEIYQKSENREQKKNEEG
mgnify:CR=1 FL=1